MINATEILSKFEIKPINAGACSGPGQWGAATDSGLLDSVDPATGEMLAQIYSCPAADYEVLVGESQRAFLEWRKVPAPKRGEVVRLIGEALRTKKDALGSLV
ncbi:MAG: aldehyde dehydrogenase family protein, partial [Nitrospirota bacterium]|nr:aldehyde dehydrogenase family protein [Nitrospirota bacterium]MDX2420049.1 aldehyde dehydrogenase family protein [Nitrospirota bacterium]